MVTDIISNISLMKGVSTIISLFMLVVLVFYLIFAFLMVRQVNLLNKSFNTDSSVALTAFSYAHMVGTILLLLFTLSTFV